MTTGSRFAIFVFTSLSLAGPALGQVPIFLPEFPVAPTDGVIKGAAGVLLDESGEFVVMWGQGGSPAEFLGRRYDAQTAPLDDPFPLMEETSGGECCVSVARDASGRFVVVWNDFGDFIRARQFEPDGTPLGDSFQVNSATAPGTSYIAIPHVASDASGNFVVTWTLFGANNEILARRFDRTGAPLGDDFPVNQFTTGSQSGSRVAAGPAGFVVVWRGAGSGTSDGIFARLFDTGGGPVTNDFPVHTAPPTSPGSTDVAMNAAGDFVVVWDDGDYTSSAIQGRRWNASGTPASGVFPISGSAPGVFGGGPRVDSDSIGNFLVAWGRSINTLGGTDTRATMGRLFGADGSLAGNEFQINEITAGSQTGGLPSLADDGSFVVVFGTSQNYQYGIQGRKSGLRASPQFVIDPSAGISSPSGGGNGNGVFEPGESLTPQTAWVNDTAASAAVSGTAVGFTGPPGAAYTLMDSAASYGTIPAGQTATCVDGADCYSISVSDPAVRPAAHWDARLQETLNVGVPRTWVIHIGESFADVPTSHLFYRFIEMLLHNGVTGGCAGGGYCPTNAVTRAQMAVFLLKAKFGAAHVPPPCTGTVFNDVLCSGGPFDPWIEELAALDVTGGCGGGNYCPNNPVTRQQMAVFLLRTLEGSGYLPPDCSGVFNDVPCTPGEGFSDWIEELADRGITGGCSVTPPLYCPTNPNNRGQMAVFLVKTFGLVLYGG